MLICFVDHEGKEDRGSVAYAQARKNWWQFHTNCNWKEGLVAMIWRYRLRSIIDGDEFGSARILDAIYSEVKLLIAQYEEKARLQKKKAPDPPDPAPEPPPVEPL